MTDLSALRKKVSDLNQKRVDAIHKVLDTKPYIAAQVYERFKSCGNPNCKCARGELHGPFLWIYQRKKGQKVVSTTVAREKAREAKELAGRYEKLLRLRQQIRETDQKINELLNEFTECLEKEVSEYVRRKEKT
jgi:hypothetical protein